MRKPWHWKARSAWYCSVIDTEGKTRTVRLSEDQQESQRIWEERYKPIPREPDWTPDRETPPPRPPKPKPPPELDHTPPPKPKPQPALKYKRSGDAAPVPYNRYQQLERVLCICELLMPLRYGATIDELAIDIRDTIGDNYHLRTIRRDLEFLDRFGVIEVVTGRPGSHRYRWISFTRSIVMAQFASTLAERRD